LATDSCTGDPHREPLLHAPVDGVGAERHRDGGEHGRTLFLDDAAAAASTSTPET